MNSAALDIHRVSQNVLSRAHRRTAHREKLVSFGQSVYVEHDFFRPIQSAALARVNRIFFPLLVARVVVIIVALIRHGHVGLLETSLDLLEKPLLKVPRMRHLFGGAIVFLIQITYDVRALPLAQPVIIIHPRMTVFLKLCGYLLNHS